MKNNSDYARGIFIGLGIAALIAIFAVFSWKWLYPIPYQNPPHAIQPASTPADIGELTTRVENLENDQTYNLKNFEWQIDQKILVLGWVALAISVVAGFMGVKTYNDIEKVVNEEVRRALDKALYHLDPTNLRIWMVSYDKDVIFKGDAKLDEAGKQKTDENKKPLFEQIQSNVSVEIGKVSERILLTGLMNLKTILQPDDKCYDGVTIVPVFDLNMEEDFRGFLERNKSQLDPKRAAFVLYTRDYYVSQTKTLSLYPNLATANMLPTVASMILTVGRGLSDAFPSKEDNKK